MPRTLRVILLLTIALSPALAYGQAKAPLPRVLILGDGVYNEPSRVVAKELKGEVDVVYVTWQPDEVPDTTTALEHLDRLLGYVDKKGEKLDDKDRPRWDLIYFNFGLGDLIYRAPGMKSFRVMPIHVGGVRNTDPKRYEANLRELVGRLRATGAKLVWASTTPIRHSEPNIFEKGSEIEYNAIAARVMSEQHVPIDDMYSYAKGLIDMDKPAPHGFDPFFFDRKPLHPPVVAVIRKELGVSESR
ncbi:MAG: hypothetical protein GC159_24030 [Phycisphaera sp.]|nr:hypothetical protein [Phycisphaera sp.]